MAGNQIERSYVFRKLTVKRKGVTRGFFESVGCKKGAMRTATVFVVGDPDSKKYQATANVGRC